MIPLISDSHSNIEALEAAKVIPFNRNLGRRFGSFKTKGDVRPLNGVDVVPCFCDCRETSCPKDFLVDTYTLASMVLEGHPGITICSAGCPNNPRIHTIEEDAELSRSLGLTTMEERIKAWDKGKFKGFLRDPRNHPDYAKKFAWDIKNLPSPQSQYFNTTVELSQEEKIQLLELGGPDLFLDLLARYNAINGFLQEHPNFFDLSPEEQLLVLKGKSDDGAPRTPSNGEGGGGINIDESDFVFLERMKEKWGKGIWPPEDIIQKYIVKTRVGYFNALRLGKNELAQKIIDSSPDPIVTDIIKTKEGISPLLAQGLSYHEAYCVWWFSTHNLGFDLSEPGAGKTRPPLRVMQHNKFSMSVVFSPLVNVGSTVSHWEKEARKIGYEATFFRIKGAKSFKNIPKHGPVVLLINPEQYANSKIVRGICSLPIDFFVIDEVQSWSGDSGEEAKVKRVNHLNQTLLHFPSALKLVMSGTFSRGDTERQAKNIIRWFKKIEVEEKGISALLRIHGILATEGWRFCCNDSNLPVLHDPIRSGKRENLIRCFLPEEVRNQLEQMKETLEKQNEYMGFLPAEQIAVPYKLQHLIDTGVVTKDNIHGTIFFTTHVTEIVPKLKKIIRDAFFPGREINEVVGEYTGNVPQINRMIKTNKPLVVSVPLMTGTNGLQKLFSNIIFLSCPWHYPDYSQAIARIWRRCDCHPDGHFPSVNIKVVVNNVKYDMKRWLRTLNCRSESDLLLNGKPSSIPLPEDTLAAMVQKELSDMEKCEAAKKDAIKYLPLSVTTNTDVITELNLNSLSPDRQGHKPDLMGKYHQKMSISEEKSLSEWSQEDRVFYLTMLKEHNNKMQDVYGESPHEYAVRKYVKPGLQVLNLASSDSTLPSDVFGVGVDLLLPKNVYQIRKDILEAGIMDTKLKDKLKEKFNVNEFDLVMCIGGIFAGGGSRAKYKGLKQSLKNVVRCTKNHGTIVIGYPPKEWSNEIPKILSEMGVVLTEPTQNNEYLYIIGEKQ